MAYDKFTQPEDGIVVVERVYGPDTLLSPDEIEIGRQRVAQGENIDEVAEDLALREIAMLWDILPVPPEDES
jgi:hypothetical protein